ncbi:MAG: hypothetical protein IBX64_12415 [Actinobacteria bacterium]|nr:hypothetical protein [Actinomycetota bacterium]
MSKNVTKMGPKALQLVSYLAQSGRHVISINDAVAFTNSRSRAQQLLSIALQKGFLIRLQRGTYLIVPLEAGPDRKWSESGFVIASAMARPAVISYLSAIRWWNWTEQLPRTVFIQTTQRKSKTKREILGVKYQFVHISPERFFGIAEGRIDDQSFHVTNHEKTLLDCVDKPSFSGGLPTISQAVETALPQIDWEKLDKYIERFKKGAATKRIMFLMEQALRRKKAEYPEADELIEHWSKKLSSGIALLDPALPVKGPILTRWRLRLNVAGFEKEIK